MALVRDSSLLCIPSASSTSDVTVPRKIVGGVCIVTSTIGFLGASLQLISLWKYRNSPRRTPSPNPRIILYLALSDLFACLGICGLSVMAFLLPSGNFTSPQIVLQNVTENITIFSFLASCIWTFSYALDMCFQIYKIECPMIVYKILCWLIPLDIVFWTQFANMKDDYQSSHQTCVHTNGMKTRLILSCIIVLITMFGNPFLFVITFNKIKRILRLSGRFTDDQRKLLSKFKKKFFWIVFVFFLCWLPNVIFLPYRSSYIILGNERYDCAFLVLLGMEAILNPLQGFFNYIVYRNAFQVAASETRTYRSPSLRHVPVPYTLWTDNNGAGGQADESTIDDDSMTRDEETPYFRSHSSTEAKMPSDSYTCRLFGE